MNFLSYVAQDIIQKYGDDTAHIAVVFPNKRAALFLNQELMRLSDKPIWSPSYITISDLFRRHSTLQVADPIKVIAELHKSFVAVTGKTETLDQFYGWGQLLLADFDDIDKNDADASKVFANLRDLHEYDDSSYLTDEQKQLLKRFFSNFHDQDSTLQKRFIEFQKSCVESRKEFPCFRCFDEFIEGLVILVDEKPAELLKQVVALFVLVSLKEDIADEYDDDDRDQYFRIHNLTPLK